MLRNQTMSATSGQSLLTSAVPCKMTVAQRGCENYPLHERCLPTNQTTNHPTNQPGNIIDPSVFSQLMTLVINLTSRALLLVISIVCLFSSRPEPRTVQSQQLSRDHTSLAALELQGSPSGPRIIVNLVNRIGREPHVSFVPKHISPRNRERYQDIGSSPSECAKRCMFYSLVDVQFKTISTIMGRI